MVSVVEVVFPFGVDTSTTPVLAPAGTMKVMVVAFGATVKFVTVLEPIFKVSGL